MKEKVAAATTAEDAEVMAGYARLPRGANGFNAFVDQVWGRAGGTVRNLFVE